MLSVGSSRLALLFEMNILIIITTLCSLIDLSLSNCESSAGGRISETKCNEYTDLIAQCKPHKPMIRGGEVTFKKSYKCNAVIGMIANGVKAKPGEFPHMAALGVKTDEGVKFVCGGSLISENFVLSAAHCFASGETINLIRLGDHNLAEQEEFSDPEDFKIKKLFIHQAYDMFKRLNDIALVELDRQVEFSKYIRPACLGYFGGKGHVVATGWGKNSTHGQQSDVLLKVSLPVLNKTNCVSRIDGLVNLDASLICAGGGKADTCSGDSGGPIQITKDNSTCVYRIVGVTSYGPKLCGTKSPALYTRVAPFIRWIEDIVWK